MAKRDELYALLKERADDHGRVRCEPDELRRKLGLSNHDMTKLLWDWRAVGALTFREDRNGGQVRVTGIELRQAPKPRTSSNDSYELVAMAITEHYPLNSEGWREWDPAGLAKLTGLSEQTVRDGMRSMRETGRLQQLGGGQRGARVEGIRWTGERAPERAPEPVQPKPAPTPAIMSVSEVREVELAGDWPSRARKYREAREAAVGNPYLTFKTDETLDYIAKLLDEITSLRQEVTKLRVAADAANGGRR